VSNLCPHPCTTAPSPCSQSGKRDDDELTETTPGRRWEACEAGYPQGAYPIPQHPPLTMGTTATRDSGKAQASCPRAAARGSQVHTANTTLTRTTRHPPPRRRATACRVDDRRFGHNEGLERQAPTYRRRQRCGNRPWPCRPQHQPAPPTTASSCS
jgi:hypothetical protein